MKMDEDGEKVWFPLTEIEQARLNVLERQDRVDEFLQLAKTADTHRYVLKLLQLGQLEKAIAASQELSESQSVLDVAQKLLAAGRLEAALNLTDAKLSLYLMPSEGAQQFSSPGLFVPDIAVMPVPTATPTATPFGG